MTEIRGISATSAGLYRCRDCGGVVSGVVPEGRHAVLVKYGKRINCVGREVQ